MLTQRVKYFSSLGFQYDNASSNSQKTLNISWLKKKMTTLDPPIYRPCLSRQKQLLLRTLNNRENRTLNNKTNQKLFANMVSVISTKDSPAVWNRTTRLYSIKIIVFHINKPNKNLLFFFLTSLLLLNLLLLLIALVRKLFDCNVHKT